MCSDWLKTEARAWLDQRVGSLGWYNYNNFIFAAVTHFIVKFPYIGYCTPFFAFKQRNSITLGENVTFWDLPGERYCPSKGFTISNRIFSSWGKSFWSFCNLQFFFFNLVERARCPRVAIFHAIVRCVFGRCCLRCCSESRLGFFLWWWWGKENGGGKSEWNRGGLSDTDSPGEGQFGRDWQVGIATPCTHINAQCEINLWIVSCMSEKLILFRCASDTEPTVLSSRLQLTVWISEASWRWRQNEGPVNEGSDFNWDCLTAKQHIYPPDTLQTLS